MIYNYTRCESVIAKIMADLDLSEKDVRITDMREWIFEAVEQIGAPTQYEEVESGVGCEPILEIQDRQVPIPNGLQFLDGVAYSPHPNGPWYPVRKDTGMFRHVSRCGHHKLTSDSDSCCQYEAIEKYHVPCVHDHCHEGFIEHPTTCNAQTLSRNGMKYLQNMYPRLGRNHEDVTYFIKPGWIVFNVPKGYVKLSYKRILTDERGLPIIPDVASYIEAVYWYVVMKLQFPKFLKSNMVGKRRINAEAQKYNYIQQQWHFYRNKAYSECMMPDAGEMRAIKNDWTKLIPDWDSDDTFFIHQGDRQNIINDYYYGY